MGIDLQVVGEKDAQKVVAELWCGIKNMIVGVTKGYEYKMRMVYAHFPMGVSIENEGKEVAIRNFLGEKLVRTVNMHAGVEIVRCPDVKDQLILRGNDINSVSQSAANIKQSTRVCDKDIRKFLDGVYVSSKANVVKD